LAKHAALMSTSKNRFARNQNNVSECSDMSTPGVFCQCVCTIVIQSNEFGLVQSGYHHHFTECNCSSGDIAEKLLIWC